jgi:hypothetical protein
MSITRRLLAPAVAVASLALALAACSGETVTGTAAPGTDPRVQLTDAQRTAVAQRLLNAGETSGDGSIAATFAAAAILGGAEIRTVSATGLSAAVAVSSSVAVPSGVRGNVTTNGGAGTYLAVAAQVTETGSPDVTSVIVAWRQNADGTPTDFVLSLAAGSGMASFAQTSESVPAAFGLVYSAPSATWIATQGTTSLQHASSGDRCRDIDGRLSGPGVTATCKLALFDGAVDIAAASRLDRPGNTAQGSATFSLANATIGGVVINLSRTAAARVTAARTVAGAAR